MPRNRKSAKAAGSLADRLWPRTETTDSGCWEWCGAKNNKGYGQISPGGGSRRTILTHRAAWIVMYGPIPEGLVVRHRCDNPPCCNPSHLELGTVADNARDAMERGRVARGPTHAHTRLSDDDVRAIRRDYRRFTVPGQRGYRVNSADLAERFGVSAKYVTAVAAGRERIDVT